jgi:hypothetical protein
MTVQCSIGGPPAHCPAHQVRTSGHRKAHFRSRATNHGPTLLATMNARRIPRSGDWPHAQFHPNYPTNWTMAKPNRSNTPNTAISQGTWFFINVAFHPRQVLKLSSPCLGFPRTHFRRDIPSKILYVFLVSPSHQHDKPTSDSFTALP